jgi:hypothetical protein
MVIHSQGRRNARHRDQLFADRAMPQTKKNDLGDDKIDQFISKQTVSLTFEMK